jgi:uncharacterized damage-inducible protein DinB
MTRSPLADAFGHNTWATLRVIDACRELSRGQLETNVPGTYGSILATARHLVTSDAYYVSVLNGGPIFDVDEEHLDLDAVRALTVETADAWSALLADDLDPDRDVVRYRDDGSESHGPMTIRLAQALHHGTDHRSQIATALTNLGIEPPEIDVWAYGRDDGRVFETEPTT